jgi:Amt family ammonium transporter
MLKTFIARMRESESRRLFAKILAGKLIGAALIVAVISLVSAYVFQKASAEDAAVVPAYINPINTMWTLIAAFLVFFMQAGFMMLEAGFARGRETVNILLEGIVDTCLCGLLFYAWGFAFMFGTGNGFIGKEFFFLQGAPETYGATGVPVLAFWLFQFAFADTCSTIT